MNAPDLETLIRDKFARREVVALTLWPSVHGGVPGWQANTTKDRNAWTIAFNADPIQALRQVLGDGGAAGDLEDMLG